MTLLVLSAPGASAADSVEERLQRLERQVETILELLSEQGLAPQSPTTPGPAPLATDQPRGETRAPLRAAAAKGDREITVAYYLSTTALDTVDPPPAAPSSSGRIDFEDTVSFDPARYDVASGIFSEYRDPARYPDVGVRLTGSLRIEADGAYEFVFHPKPAREGASSVGTAMALRLRVDDRTLLRSDPVGSWKPVRLQTGLTKGVHTVDLWVVSRSPGYGPSPTASRLVVSLKGPGDASPRPWPLAPIER